jgi:hypothetical protein
MVITKNDEFDPMETKRVMDEYAKSDICIEHRKRLKEWEQFAMREGYIIPPKQGYEIIEL